MRKRYIALLIIMLMVFAACGRVPKPSTSQKIIHKYFKKYAKKYPATEYGQSKVAKVEIDSQQEIRKHFVAVKAFIVLEDGNLKKIHVTEEKKSLGWRFVSWEDATGL